MTIEEMNGARSEAEDKIANILFELEKITGLYASDIWKIDTIEDGGSNLHDRLVSRNVKIELILK